MQDFLAKNKVFLSGLAASLILVLQQFTSADTIDWKVIGFAAGISVLSFFAKEWRGQGASILGIVGSLAGVLSDELTKGSIDISKLVLFTIVAVLGAAAPPMKQQAYEQSPTIEGAKQEAVVIKEEEKIIKEEEKATK